MIVTNITFNQGLYSVEYTNNDTDIKKLSGKIIAENVEDEILTRFNFLSEDIRDSFWINRDEYIILVPKDFECLPDDYIIPLGKMRFYITNHMDYECIFSFEIKSEEELDATALQFAIKDYLKWD